MTVVHCKREKYDVYIGRKSLNVPDDNGGRWGNPFSHSVAGRDITKVATRDEAVACYRVWLWEQIRAGKITLPALAELHGKRLGCWCAPQACHGEVLAAAAAWAATQITVCECGGFDALNVHYGTECKVKS